MPYRAWLLVVFLAALAASAVRPRYPVDFALEHLLTVAFVAWLVWVDRRRPLSNASCTLILAFMLLHVLGARTTYSEVPYDAWAHAVFGVSVSEAMAWERNHYDRFVHLAYGLLLVLPMREMVERGLPLVGWRSLLVAVAFLAVLSKVYELLEWMIAEIMSPDDAGRYNGEQGDVYDAQKDMALAFAGTLVSAAILAVRDRRLNRSRRSASPRA